MGAWIETLRLLMVSLCAVVTPPEILPLGIPSACCVPDTESCQSDNSVCHLAAYGCLTRRLDFVQSLIDVVENVVNVLDANAQTDEVGSDAGLAQLLVAELAMGMAGGMEHTGAGIGHVGDDVDHLERVHPLDGRLARTFKTKGNDATGAVGQVLLAEGIGRVVGQTAIVNPGHLLVIVQELGHLLGVLAVLRHAEVERLQAEVQEECVLRSGDGAEVAHELGHELGGEAHLAERLDVGEAVVGLVGRAEAGELSPPTAPEGASLLGWAFVAPSGA